MGLIGKIFGGGKAGEGTGSNSTQFHESEPDAGDEEEVSRNTRRRELVQVVLRDTMRKHGVPSDWIECRMLSSFNKAGRQGLHVNFVVKQAHDRLLAYVFSFQDGFERELARYEPRARDWLLSLGWEFQGFNVAEMPDPRDWAQSGPAPLTVMPGLQPKPEPAKAAKAVEADGPRGDDDVQRDLRALFAIRDAALADAAGRPRPEQDEPEPNDFQPTQPFADPDEDPKK
jgi:hypothetical protein